MDYNLDLVQTQNPVIGKEFLTWLWYLTEARGNVFSLPDGSSFTLNLEQRITVQGGEGDSTETAVCSGLMTEMREARTGLKTGKKVQQAKVRIQKDSMEWTVGLDAANLNFTSMKTPKIDTQDSDDDPDALVLEKIYLLEKGTQCLDAAFALFLEKRLGADWEQERQAMRKWILNEDK